MRWKRKVGFVARASLACALAVKFQCFTESSDSLSSGYDSSPRNLADRRLAAAFQMGAKILRPLRPPDAVLVSMKSL